MEEAVRNAQAAASRAEEALGARTEEKTGLEAKLAGTVAERDKLQRAAADAVNERDAFRDKLVQMEGMLADRDAELKEVHDRAWSQGDEIGRLKGELDLAKAELANTVGWLEEGRSGLEIAEKRCAVLESEIRGIRNELAATLEREAAKLASADAEVTVLRDKLHYTESALTQRRHETEQTALDLAAARSELKQATAARDEAALQARGLHEHVALLMADLRDRQVAIEALEGAKSQLLSRLEVAEASHHEAETLRGQLNLAIRSKQEMESSNVALKSHIELLSADLRKCQDTIKVLDTQRQEISSQLEAARESESLSIQASAALELQIQAMRKAASIEIGRTVTTISYLKRWPLETSARYLKRRMDLVNRSGLFDKDWYLAHNEDVANAGVDPLRHYVEYGAREGREPNGIIARSRGEA